MPALTKVVSGLIYNNEFDVNELEDKWILSPSSAYYSLTEKTGYLRIGGADSMILVNPIVNEYTLTTKIDYDSTDTDSSAGLILYRDNNSYIKLESYFNDLEYGIVYSYLKIKKEDLQIFLYGSRDGYIWILIGSLNIGGTNMMVGFYTTGTLFLDIDMIQITKSDKILFSNIGSNYRIGLYNSDDELVGISAGDENERVIFDNNLSINGYVKLFDQEDNIIYQTEPSLMYGGDEFRYDVSIEVQMKFPEDNLYHILDSENPVDLGFFTSSTIERMMMITNIDDVILTKIQIDIIPNSIFKDGYKNTELLESIGGQYVPIEGNILICNLVNPGDSIEFGLKINRDDPSISDPNYAFNIRVRAW